MGRRVQLIRHSTGEADAFVGLQGEITVDTTKKEFRLGDGLTAGGIPQARADLDNVDGATTTVDGKLIAADKQKLDFLGLTQAADLDAIEIDLIAALLDIIAIETKTDFITITQAVNLDTLESNVAAAAAELAFIAVTQAVDLDTMESDIATNNAKITNATHTGDVTGSTALAIGTNKVLTTMILNANVTLAKLANMATASFMGRNTAGSGVPEILSATAARAILNVANGANNYSHPNHTGDVTSTGDGATTIVAGAVDTTQIAAAAVGRSQIANSTTTSAGSLNSTAGINIALNDWALFPMIHGSVTYMEVLGHSSDGGSASAPRFRLHNNTGGSLTWDVDHRWIIAA